MAHLLYILEQNINPIKLMIMKKYICDVCGWEYDPAVGAEGIPAGTPWEQVAEDFVCPLCGVGKDEFSPAE